MSMRQPGDFHKGVFLLGASNPAKSFMTGKAQCEGGAFCLSAFDAEVGVVGLHDFLDNGQAQACAFAFGGKIGIENFIDMLGGDAVAGVAYGNPHVVVFFSPALHVQGAALRHGLDSVQIEIQQALRQPVGVYGNLAKIILDVGLDVDAVVVGVLMD